MIGQRFQLADPGLQRVGFPAQLIDLAHKGQQRALYVRRQLRLWNTHNAGCVHRRWRRGLGARGLSTPEALLVLTGPVDAGV